VTWSLNEIEAAAKRAARGAGQSWGLAEEAGRATRWLCAAGWPGADSLAALLDAQDGRAWAARRPAIAGDRWTAQDGPLCPLATGAALGDRAALWAAGVSARIGPVAHPLLMIPFMVWAADRTGARLALAWPGLSVTRHAGETWTKIATPASLAPPMAETVRIGPAHSPAGQPLRRAYRADIAPQSAGILHRFAHRTYAPDTPESRLAGAGAGLSDND